MVPSIRIITLFITLVVTVAGAAQEVSIFVDTSADPLLPQIGTVTFPFRTITRALELARKIRFGCPANQIPPSTQTINVHVARGTHVGTYASLHHPSLETLPIVLNVPHLRLKGALLFDSAGKVIP
jgi:hypothetical protein